nr:LytTR family DNA-binding domain-containing protein [Butyrivibrio sp. X503]
MDEFESGESLIESVNNNNDQYDMIFVDYNIGNNKSSGAEIIRKLRMTDKNASVVFFSKSIEAVFDAFKVEAFRFYLKPIIEEQIFETLNDYIKSKRIGSAIEIKHDNSSTLCKTNTIVYVEGDGKNSIIHLLNRNAIIEHAGTLSSVEKQLHNNNFYRCHKSFLINFDYVNSYSRTEIQLTNGDIIPISRNKYKDFFLEYKKYFI